MKTVEASHEKKSKEQTAPNKSKYEQKVQLIRRLAEKQLKSQSSRNVFSGKFKVH